MTLEEMGEEVGEQTIADILDKPYESIDEDSEEVRIMLEAYELGCNSGLDELEVKNDQIERLISFIQTCDMIEAWRYISYEFGIHGLTDTQRKGAL